MNAHLFIIYRPVCVCVNEWEVGRENAEFPLPVSAAVHRIDVLNDSAQES